MLLKKLQYYGLRDTTLYWFKSYLSDRTQYVEYDGVASAKKLIETGVPQDSILGPLLFVIYMNDIQTVSEHLNFILYADDTTLTSMLQCYRKTFMVHQTFVRWTLYIIFKIVKSLIRHLGLAIRNVRQVWWFSWTLTLCTFTQEVNHDVNYMSYLINLELSKISDWLPVNKLSLNVDKTKNSWFFITTKKWCQLAISLV